MVKQTLWLVALATALSALLAQPVVAQDSHAPSLRQALGLPPSPPPQIQIKPLTSISHPPSYCKPCLFYGGDFDPSGPYPNGLYNGDTVWATGETLVPFTVPFGQRWLVEGLFTNDLTVFGTLDPPEATWSISQGVSTDNAGYTIASGTASATSTATGRSLYAYYFEYTILVNIKPMWLYPGTYWMTVVPVCTNGSDPNCDVPFYLSDSEDTPPLNGYGPPEPWDLSYFYSVDFGGWYYLPAAPDACGADSGCDRFSAGVLGKAL